MRTLRLIIISGAKYTNKELVASRLAKNSDCIWIKPYTDRPSGHVEYEQDDYFHLDESKLSAKMERDKPLAVVELNNHRYVFFENQLHANYCILIGDDSLVSYFKNNWEGDLLTVKCHSKNEKYSQRNILGDDEFDVIFNTDDGDYDELEELVGDIYHYEVD